MDVLPAIRVTVNRTQATSEHSSSGEDIRPGLFARQKALLPKYVYDDMGAILFEAICHLPEYYVARAETEILQSFCGDIIDAMPGPLTLIEAGSGSAAKTRMIIATILQRQPSLHYIPMELSHETLLKSAMDLTAAFANLHVTAYAGDYFDTLRLLKDLPTARKLVLFLGTSLGNFEPPTERSFLQLVRSILQPGEAILLGLDLKKSAAILEAAYDDALGVTAAFNLNQLNRLNRECGAQFDLRRFAHRAVYNQELGRVEMHLVSRCTQTVPVHQWDRDLYFAEGETIHTHSSYKYDQPQIHRLARQTNFSCVHTWQDAKNFFSLNLLVAQ